MAVGPSDWFDPLYAEAQRDAGQIPWALMEPCPYLTDWLHTADLPSGQSAAVVGCGLGDDAESLAQAGFEVMAFDISQTAIEWAQSRFPESSVTYAVADLFQLPDAWQQRFDLVFEFRTIQALPLAVRAEAMAQIAKLVAPSGTLLVTTYLRETEAAEEGPPWPLSDTELTWFTNLGMRMVQKDLFHNRDSRFRRRARLAYRWT